MKFKFSKDHASNKKGDTKNMPESTAKALEAHKIGKCIPEKEEEKPEE